MYRRTTVLIIVAILWAVGPILGQENQAGESSASSTKLQGQLRYVNPLVMENAGRLADPTLTLRDTVLAWLDAPHGALVALAAGAGRMLHAEYLRHGAVLAAATQGLLRPGNIYKQTVKVCHRGTMFVQGIPEK